MKQRTIRNLKAFTIAELLIVMILSSIVITTIYLCYSVVFGYFNSYRNQFSSVNSIYQFSSRLENLCETCDYIVPADSSIRFIGSQKEVTVYCSNGLIIYSANYSGYDTLPITASSFKLETEGQGERMYVESIEVEALLFGEPLTLSFEKSYSSRQLMLLNQNE